MSFLARSLSTPSQAKRIHMISLGNPQTMEKQIFHSSITTHQCVKIKGYFERKSRSVHPTTTKVFCPIRMIPKCLALGLAVHCFRPTCFVFSAVLCGDCESKAVPSFPLLGECSPRNHWCEPSSQGDWELGGSKFRNNFSIVGFGEALPRGTLS